MAKIFAIVGHALTNAIGITMVVLLLVGGANATKIINNNAAGGDCTSFGTWNPTTKTCTMTTDLIETVQIDSNRITLDGNGHTLTGSNTGDGVYLYGRTAVTIKNLNVKEFYNGIYLYSSSDNTLIGNNASYNMNGIYLSSSSNNNMLKSNNALNSTHIGIYLSSSNNNMLIGNNESNTQFYYGIYLESSSNNTLIGNTASKNYDTGIGLATSSNNMLIGNIASNNGIGIQLFSSSDNTLSGNIMINNRHNFYLGYNNWAYNNNIDTSNTVDGKPIYYLQNISDKVFNASANAGVFVCINCNNITIKDSVLTNNGNGILFWKTNNSKIYNITASKNYIGIYLYSSNNNMLNGNNVSISIEPINSLSRGAGIYLYSSSNNTLIGNIASHNRFYGIFLYSSSNNKLNGNDASSNSRNGIYLESSSNKNTLIGNNAASNINYGIYLSSSSENKIYNNIFNNTNNFQFISSNISTWNITKQSGTNIIGGPYLGGNFWAAPNGTGFSQKCADANKDGICDAKYTLNSNNIDLLPLAEYTATIVTVKSPNGGENWQVGTTQKIQWTYTGNPGSYVKIELLKGGVSNSVITSSTSAVKSGSGSNNWLINSTQIMGTNYKIRVTSTTNSAYTDTSNNNFTITVPGITVVSPNGGETWTRGLTQTIKWTYIGNPGSSVKIELMKGGVLNRVINSSTSKGSNGSGSYNWLINSIQTLGSDYKVRVTSTSSPVYTDTSNNNFTINPPISCKTSTIYGYSFIDTNGNKIKDSGEAGLSSRTINLKGYDTCKRTLVSKIITTNTTGYFAFKSINSGSYVLSEDYSLGWLPTNDAAYTLSIPSVSVTIRKDFGNTKFK